MRNELEYLHLSDRNRQIEVLEERAPHALRQHIKKTFDYIVGEGKKIERNDDPNDVERRMKNLANEFASSKPESINFEPSEESYIISRELIKEIIPRIKKLRLELFKTEVPPFPIQKKENFDRAIEWLRKEEKKQSLQWKNTVEKEFGGAKNLRNEREKIEKEIHNLLSKLRKITPTKIFPPKYISILLPCPGEKGWVSYIRVMPGSSLEKLEKTTKEIAEETNLQQASLVMFTLTGISPLSVSYRMRKKIGKKNIFEIEIYRFLIKKEAEELLNEVKKFFKKGKDFIKKEHEFLYDIVEKQKNKRDYKEKTK
ncbi:MAG: hypothetical protein U9O41_01070, partial [Candidatus Aerophobetes bacterium]|nr:hypothetical protein [Candidatus Aerophobetes bacterium]